MNQKIEKLLLNLKNKKVGVFCDDSNLYHSYKKYGWRVDFEKFKKFLVACEEQIKQELETNEFYHFYLDEEIIYEALLKQYESVKISRSNPLIR